VAPGTGAGGFGVRLTFPHLDATGEVVVLSATNGDRWDENGGVRSHMRTGLPCFHPVFPCSTLLRSKK
jgi:hypothetical protein